MSIQSDIEMLSIQAMEAYAFRYHISMREAGEIFHRHQIFERIIMQHEYLHQVSFDEVMEFVERLIREKDQELLLFHGTVAEFDVVELEKSHNRRDFGRGFYTTLLENQAKEWGFRLGLREKASRYYVYQFMFEESEILKVKRFEALNREWLEFVKENRSKGGLQHSYDVVIGPVADDNTMETIQLYISGILTVDEAVDRLKYSKVNNQVSFHTQTALNHLRMIGRTAYDG